MYTIYNRPLKVGEKFSGMIYRNGKKQIMYYENVHDMISDADNNINVWDYSKLNRGRDEWRYGSDYQTLEATREALRDGRVMQKFIDTVEEGKFNLLRDCPEILELEQHAFKTKRVRRFKECGHELDIDRAMSGELECWEMRDKQKNKKCLKILINVVENGSVSASKFIKSMILFASISDIINKANISTEIFVGGFADHTGHSEQKFSMCIYKVKDADAPLDLSSLLSTGLPGFFRYYMFLMYYNLLDRCSYGIGYAVQHNNESVNEAKEFLNIDLVIHPSASGNPALLIGEVIKLLNAKDI